MPPQIPKLAEGGYVKPNTPQLAMIGDNRHPGRSGSTRKETEADGSRSGKRSWRNRNHESGFWNV